MKLCGGPRSRSYGWFKHYMITYNYDEFTEESSFISGSFNSKKRVIAILM